MRFSDGTVPASVDRVIPWVLGLTVFLGVWGAVTGSLGGSPTTLPTALVMIGLTERVELVGGRLTAGRQPDSGFTLLAQLPAPAQPPVITDLPAEEAR